MIFQDYTIKFLHVGVGVYISYVLNKNYTNPSRYYKFRFQIIRKC